MGWTFDWVSSRDSDFNFDFAVSFTDDQKDSSEKHYNFDTMPFTMDEAPGFSVFEKGATDDILNSTYHIIDMTPKGRDEAGLSFPMAWLKRHDQYE